MIATAAAINNTGPSAAPFATMNARMDLTTVMTPAEILLKFTIAIAAANDPNNTPANRTTLFMPPMRCANR